MARKLSADKWLFTITIVLVMFGLVMVYSASAVLALEKYGNPFYHVIRQGIWFAIGLAGMWVVMHVPYRQWNQKHGTNNQGFCREAQISHQYHAKGPETMRSKGATLNWFYFWCSKELT